MEEKLEKKIIKGLKVINLNVMQLGKGIDQLNTLLICVLKLDEGDEGGGDIPPELEKRIIDNKIKTPDYIK